MVGKWVPSVNQTWNFHHLVWGFSQLETSISCGDFPEGIYGRIMGCFTIKPSIEKHVHPNSTHLKIYPQLGNILYDTMEK